MNKLTNRSTFRELTKIIDGNIGINLRNTNNSYKYSKSYTGRDHVMTMLFLQLSGSNGLRDIDTKYKKLAKVKKDFNMPSFSQLSRLNKNKPVSLFRNIFESLLIKATKQIKSPVNINKFKDIKIIDSSVVNIGRGLAPELYYQDNKSAIRVSTLFSYGTKIPNKINIVPAKIGERNCIKGYVDSQEYVYLFDKGYFKYSWYDDMTDKNLKFITRQQSNAVTEEESSVYTGIDNMYDYLVRMGSSYSKNKTRHKYREILYFTNDSDEEFRLVTNIFDMPAQDIVSLYKKRWNIELFFKWIKQHLTIKKWVGRSLNAISIQIYSALIIYILLLLLKEKYKSELSLFNILRKIQPNILETYGLRNILLR